MAETKVMTVTELELKILVLQKKREGQHLERAELNRLCRAIWRNRRALKREKHLTKIKEKCRDGESLQENKKQAFQLEFDCKARESRNGSHKLLPRPRINACGPTGPRPSREDFVGWNCGKT